MAVLGIEELKKIGFKSLGENVRISDKASFYNPANISVGDNSRIDDFSVISAGAGGVEIGRNVHLAVYSSIIGAGKIILSDFANISSRVSIYSSSDDYSGSTMTNPTVPAEYTAVHHAPVIIGRHVIVGAGSVILPGVELGNGVAIGALSLVRDSCEEFKIYAGTPAKFLKNRSKDLLLLEVKYLSDTK